MAPIGFAELASVCSRLPSSKCHFILQIYRRHYQFHAALSSGLPIPVLVCLVRFYEYALHPRVIPSPAIHLVKLRDRGQTVLKHAFAMAGLCAITLHHTVWRLLFLLFASSNFGLQAPLAMAGSHEPNCALLQSDNILLTSSLRNLSKTVSEERSSLLVQALLTCLN